MKSKPILPDVQAAESLAISALTYLAADADRLGRFLALTGTHPENIREMAKNPGFLTGVLDHFLGDESLLFAFAADSGCHPGNIGQARSLLDRGSAPEWTGGSHNHP